MKAWVADIPPTDTEDGWRSRECYYCPHTEVEILPANHTHVPSGWIVVVSATETEAGSKHKICTECSAVLETQSIPATGPGHAHTWADTYSMDATHHWKACIDCGVYPYKSFHSAVGWIVDTEATATTAGSKHRECAVCGYVVETAVIPVKDSGGGGGLVMSFTLTFDTDGGGAIASLSKVSGSVVDLSAYVPIRDGYLFGGWFEDSALQRAVTSVTLQADTTVYAKWTAKDAESTTPFADVSESDWFYEAVTDAYERGLMSGTGGTAFDPHGATTRSMIVTTLHRLAGLPAASMPNLFDDVAAERWYTDAVVWATENNIVSGYGDGKFGGEDAITREQVAAILQRFIEAFVK